MEQNLDLKVLLYMVRKRLFLLIIAAFIGAISAFLISEYLITDSFVSKTQVYISNTEDFNYAAKVDGSDLSTARSMADTYCIILLSQRARDLLDAKLLQNEIYLSTPEKQRTNSVYVEVSDGSQVLDITAKALDPVIAALVCNTMVDVSAELVSEIFKSGRSNSLGDAKINYTPASPKVRQNMIIGILAGMIIAVGIIVLTFLVDNRVKDESDFARKVGIPVLGEVPSMHLNSSSKEVYTYYAATEKEKR